MTTHAFPSLPSLEALLEDEAFHLLYQPILEGNAPRIAGIEVLLRFRTKEPGLFPPGPDILVPRLEEAGLIGEMTSRIVGRVARDLSRTVVNPFWSLHLNVSPLQILSEPGRCRLEKDLEAFAAIHRHSLVLEITENRFRISKKTWGRLAEWMEDLQMKIGDLSWYLDDFGRGENFETLDLPIQGMKIDRAFSTQESLRPLRAIAQIAKGFGWNVVAEGIETREELRRIRSVGITNFQGHLAWKPLPIDQFKGIRC